MAVAIQVHERRRFASRFVASVAALLVVVTGVLAMAHAAEVRHVRDPHSGDFVHAQELAERHEHGATSHVHGRASHDHADGGSPCTLLGIVHGAIASVDVATACADASVARAVVPPSHIDPRAIDYRIAPKTSPPARS